MKTKKLEVDLPGHADEVYAVDWSPDGQRVVSGGKDKVLKMYVKFIVTKLNLGIISCFSTDGDINENGLCSFPDNFVLTMCIAFSMFFI